MNLEFKKDGYVARILTWGMTPRKKERYLDGLQNGCPMFWRFVFMFCWSLGGLRNDHAEPNEDIVAPKKRNETMARINAAVSDFSETKAAQRIGQGIGYTFIGALGLLLAAIVCVVLFGIGTLLYGLFMSGWENVLTAGIVIVVMFVAVTCVFLLCWGLKRLARWVRGTEGWALFIQKVKSLKEKTCPVVQFA